MPHRATPRAAPALVRAGGGGKCGQQLLGLLWERPGQQGKQGQVGDLQQFWRALGNRGSSYLCDTWRWGDLGPRNYQFGVRELGR